MLTALLLATIGAALVAFDTAFSDAHDPPALGYLGFLLIIVASWGALFGVGLVALVLLGLLAVPLLVAAVLCVAELLEEGCRLARPTW